MLVGFLFQLFGLQGITPAVSAFLTSLYVLFTVLLVALVHRTLPHWLVLVGALSATLGAAYISGPPQLNFGLGEWLTVVCAFVFAVHILATDTITRRCPPMPVTWITFIVAAAGGAATLAWGARGPAGPSRGGAGRAGGHPRVLPAHVPLVALRDGPRDHLDEPVPAQGSSPCAPPFSTRSSRSGPR